MTPDSSLTLEPSADRDAIQAVLLGQQDRFAELVERYQRTVYGIAWSRVREGDAAEDIVQETFLQAYRFLPLLRNPERFPGWLTRIARNLANRAARRSSREKRVLVEQSPEHDQLIAPRPGSVADPAASWNLTRAMQEIPVAYREALVLYYVEENDIRDCAARLGVSENSFKTRLHRARKSMKHQLERSLEQELNQLGRGVDVTPQVMSGIAAIPLATGGLGGLSAALVKAAPMLFQAGLTCALWALWDKSIADNFRDPRQVRRRLMQRTLAIRVLTFGILLGAGYVVQHYYGIRPLLVGLGALLLYGTLPTIRAWKLSRLQRLGALALGNGIWALGAIAYGIWPVSILMLIAPVFVVQFLVLIAMRDVPLRMDYNLFQRAAMDTLPTEVAPPPTPVTPQQLDGFGRFLASRDFAIDRRRSANGWELVLPPLAPSMLQFVHPFPPHWPHASRLFIDETGSCRASASQSDLKTLARLFGKADGRRLEAAVEAAAATALQRYAADDSEGAVRALQAEEDIQLFKSPPSELKCLKTTKIVSILGAVLLFAMMILNYLLFSHGR